MKSNSEESIVSAHGPVQIDTSVCRITSAVLPNISKVTAAVKESETQKITDQQLMCSQPKLVLFQLSVFT